MSDFTVGALRSAHRPSLRHAITTAVLFLQTMMRARATRRLLADMDDRLLADIGMGRGDALHEAQRPMWDLAQRRN